MSATHLPVGDRILFVAHTGDWTGPTKSLLLLLEGLRPHYNVAVLVPGRGDFSAALEDRGIRHFSFRALTKWSMLSLVRLLRGQEVDLVYANNTYGLARIAFLAARLAGASYVCHVRGMAWERTWLSLGYLRWADAVIAVSRSCADSVRRFVRPSRLHVVYNGVPQDVFSNCSGVDRRQVRARLGLSTDSIVLLSVSHVAPRKGQEHALAALAQVVASLPSAHLCLVGSLTRDTGYVDRVRVLAREYGVEGHVHLLGFRRDIPELLQSADVFVHTAVADPHPRAVLEAMAAGLPVVAFGVDGVAETVVDGETGRLVPPGDTGALAAAVQELVACDGLRVRFGDAARRRVEKVFSDRATAAGVQRILDAVLSARKR